MKRACHVFIILILCLNAKAQRKLDLNKDELIIAIWEYSDYDKDPKGGAPIIAEEAQNFIYLMPDKESWFATSFDAENPGDGFSCPSDFIAMIDKNIISGTLIRACAVVLAGTKFSFKFKYIKKDNSLLVTCNGKNYKYVRFNFEDYYNVLKADDPLIGTWRFADYEIHPDSAAPIVGKEQQLYVHFEPINKKSWFAVLYDDEHHEYGCISEFVAHPKKDEIYGYLTYACKMDLKDSRISFRYKYNKSDDSLDLIYEGKTYKYLRFHPGVLIKQ